MIKLIHYFFFITSLILSIYALSLVIFYQNISFSKLLGIFSTLLASYCLYQIKTNFVFYKKLPPILNILLITITLILSLSFIIIESHVVYYASHYDNINANKIIVLGAGLHKDKVSLSLQYRLDQTIQYVSSHPDAIIIVSGGQGRGESVSEAYAMKKYLTSKGIDESRIIEENQSTSTYENLLFSKQFIESSDQTIIITNNFHVFRTRLIASRLNIEPYTIPAKSHSYTFLNFCIREFFAYIKDYIKIK